MFVPENLDVGGLIHFVRSLSLWVLKIWSPGARLARVCGLKSAQASPFCSVSSAKRTVAAQRSTWSSMSAIKFLVSADTTRSGLSPRANIRHLAIELPPEEHG